MKVSAIIPVRGGSKGIPRKNLYPLGGRPLLAYTVEAAVSATRINRVIVSTDDDEISTIAGDYGAEVITRPVELAGDEATSESALLHVLDRLRVGEGYEPDLVVFLQATSPIRGREDIDGAVDLLISQDADSLFSGCRVHGFVWRRHHGDLRSVSYDFLRRKRRQEMGEDYLENGSIYVFKPWVLRETGNRLGGKIVVYEMDPLHSFQVDEPADIELMERILRLESPSSGIPKLEDVRLLVLDFDGVLTDDSVIVKHDGTEAVLCHRGDGLGIERFRKGGGEVVVLSKETSPVVAARCQKLGIECIQGCDDKLPALKSLVAARGLERREIAYVGNDVNDIECVDWAGVGIAVANACDNLKRVASWVTHRTGGRGAVREVCDAIIQKKYMRGMAE